MSEKAPDAYRTISEVAENLDLPQHVLRFWETRFAQIKPLKRAGGRRYYRPDDLALLRGIRELLYGRGYTIRGVQKILRDMGAKEVQRIGLGGPTAVLAMPAPEAVEPDDAGSANNMAANADQAPGTVTASNVPKAATGIGDIATLRGKLDRVLAELTECRRLVEAARTA